MNSNNLLRVALATAALAFSATVFAQAAASAPAKGMGTRQNHHCKQSDGTMDMGKTRKACLADKGTWTKDAADTAPAASAAAKK